MTIYTPPTKDILFAINELADLQGLNAIPAFEEATPEMVSTLIDEASKYYAEVLAPSNPVGDEQGMQLVDSNVIAPESFVDAYAQLVEGGWVSLPFPVEEGGYGFPDLVELAMVEMMQSSNIAFSMCPLLAAGVARVLRIQGNEQIKSLYLPKIASGEWATAMSLTEPQSGSDLAGLLTKATPENDYYRIAGKKIFISFADHNMSENILHLVLARLPDAPAGSRGLSLFLVPKFIPNEDGSLGARNDFEVTSIEHKLGLRASPTCSVSYGENEGAIGYLIGEQNKGLSAMFILMNHARIQVGMQGASIVERAYQMAVSYAEERRQGVIKSKGKTPVNIIEHADVRRMLGLMKAGKDAMKGLGYVAVAGLDLASHGESPETRQFNESRVALLTPIMKGWCTEFAQELTQLAVQVYGGMGYVEETGVTQFMRDARVITIYEGTTGIQSMDLMGRKLLADGGSAYKSLLDDMTAVAEEFSQADKSISVIGEKFSAAVTQLTEIVNWILENHSDETVSLEAIAFDFMMMSGYVAGGWQMARAALISQQKLAAGTTDEEYYKNKIAVSQFYSDFILPRINEHAQIVKGKGQSVEQLVF